MPRLDSNQQSTEPKSVAVPLCYWAISLLYIILFSPLLVNPLSGTLSLGAAVHSSNLAILPVARRDLPRLAEVDMDCSIAAVVCHSMVPVVDGNTVVDIEGNIVVAVVVV